MFLIYLSMYWPIPNLMKLAIGLNEYDLGWLSADRWYFKSILIGRLLAAVGERLRVPSWLQIVVAFSPLMLPAHHIFFTFNFCGHGSLPKGALPITRALFMWYDAEYCSMVNPWECWYIFLYVAAFHFSRPMLSRIAPLLPRGPQWGTAAVCASMLLGVFTCLVHYPMQALDSAGWMRCGPIEFGVSVVQPVLFALGMVYLPVDLSYWGNGTLVVYIFHFYFTAGGSANIRNLLDPAVHIFAWDPTGLLTAAAIVSTIFVVQTVLVTIGKFLVLVRQHLLLSVTRSIAWWRTSCSEA
eukprot:gnl/TRDRNA2_/TRDRNA2_166838_c0_seq1.p1 gnl/TRDRNA2_/TRDRNA2_166838_c0~~gnl/TRDRNA2_/TRDRNA2_166838_c0_seq1.p1  ORF type:complete len:297 (+),score=32.76 gnl/TRDRNA2_/TRDRNA2_166838_c0_seq1:65-955(+)